MSASIAGIALAAVTHADTTVAAPPLSPSPGAAVGVPAIAQFSARMAYALMCLTLSWGIFTRTGWMHRLGDRKTVRSGHMVLAMLTLVFGVVHAGGFLALPGNPFRLIDITVPFLPGGFLRHTMGIIGLEVMIAVALTAGIYRWTSYRRYIWLHRLAYPAVAITAAHSWFGAMANGNLALLWLGGLTLLVPTATLVALRFAPNNLLVRVGLVEEDV